MYVVYVIFRYNPYIICGMLLRLCCLFIGGFKHVMNLYPLWVEREDFQCNSHVSDGFLDKLYHCRDLSHVSAIGFLE